MSKMHKTSKRKDLAFITYSSHDEAKKAAENYKYLYGNSNMQNDQDYSALNPLGNNVTVSLAFSQQAMQAKKKVKESRKNPMPSMNPTNLSHHKTSMPISGMGTYIAGVPKISTQLGVPNIHGISGFSNSPVTNMMNLSNNVNPIPTNIPSPSYQVSNLQAQTNINPSTFPSNLNPSSFNNLNNPNLNSTAMLAMMNIINLNKVRSI